MNFPVYVSSVFMEDEEYSEKCARKLIYLHYLLTTEEIGFSAESAETVIVSQFMVLRLRVDDVKESCATFLEELSSK